MTTHPQCVLAYSYSSRATFFYFGRPVLIHMTVGFTKRGTRIRFLSSEILILCTHVKPECGPHYLMHTGTYMLTHTWTHICRAHARRQAYTCRRICDYNQINWSISPWKHHIHTWRPLVAFSWMLLTLTRGQAAGSGSAGSQRALWHQHLLTAYMFEKLLQPRSLWQRRNFSLRSSWEVPVCSSRFSWMWHRDTFFATQHKHESWCCLAEAAASSKRAAKHAWPLRWIL